jgi:site-specific recombinase XerD
MLEQFFENPAIRQRLQSQPLSPYLDSYVASLHAQGYAISTVRCEIWHLASFGRWLAQNGTPVSELATPIVDDYVSERRREGLGHRSLRPSLQRFLDHLRCQNVIPTARPAATEKSTLAHVESGYETYLRTERGLTTATVHNYGPFVHRFLIDCFGQEAPRFREIRSPDISGFILRHAHSMSPGRAKLMVSALRSFFRFLLQQGEIEADLAACVPTVADWRLSTVPKHIDLEEVNRLLRACDQSTARGRRDYAVLLLLARLGFRAGEVVALELDDVNWRAGEITVRGKGLRQDRLPLLADIGAALAAYLSHDRPECQTRRFFVRMRAPLRGFASAVAVSTIVRRALERAGVDAPRKGAHLLRHSLATGLINRGASMTEIGEILRHRLASTTEIYAKVDRNGLRFLAQPWPGNGGGR